MEKVVLESKNDCIAMMFGLAQLCPSDLFSQCAIALNKESLLFYNDNCYDMTGENNNHIHKIRINIPLNQLVSVVITNFIHNKKFKNYRKLSFIVDSQEKSIDVFYFKKDDKIVSNYLKMLKKIKNIKISYTKYDLREDY